MQRINVFQSTHARSRVLHKLTRVRRRRSPHSRPSVHASKYTWPLLREFETTVHALQSLKGSLGLRLTVEAQAAPTVVLAVVHQSLGREARVYDYGTS